MRWVLGCSSLGWVSWGFLWDSGVPGGSWGFLSFLGFLGFLGCSELPGGWSSGVCGVFWVVEVSWFWVLGFNSVGFPGFGFLGSLACWVVVSGVADFGILV